VGRPVGKRTLGRPRSKWEDNIKMDIQEVGCGVMDWIKMAQDRDRWRAPSDAVMNHLQIRKLQQLHMYEAIHNTPLVRKKSGMAK